MEETVSSELSRFAEGNTRIEFERTDVQNGRPPADHVESSPSSHVRVVGPNRTQDCRRVRHTITTVGAWLGQTPLSFEFRARNALLPFPCRTTTTPTDRRQSVGGAFRRLG